MDDQAQQLLQALRRSSAPVDQKLALFNQVKSNIKHLRVPESAQPTIFECIRLAISQQAAPTLSQAAFSTFGHLVKRLKLQNQGTVVASQGQKLFAALLDRLGDPRESTRLGAAQALSEIWPFHAVEVEKIVRDGALGGTNPRQKESAMLWVVKMSKDQSLQFRSFVPYLVANLEDRDGGVRDIAKSAVVDLFSNAPQHAKLDVKKQMKGNNVRPSTMNPILSALGLDAPPPSATETEFRTSVPAKSFEHLQPDKGLAESLISESAMPASQEVSSIEPLYLHSQREMDDKFRTIQPHFEGKESESNWMPRDKGVLLVRRMTQGNAPSDYLGGYIGWIRQLHEGILKVANSLRTTVSTNGCQLVQELARTLGPGFDPMTEISLQNFVKMTANTKHIAAQNGHVTVEAILSSVTCNIRLMQHVSAACGDKNVQTRVYAPEWLRTLIRREAQHKSHFEATGMLELAEGCIRKGLSDANPKVKESMRGTYWTFAKVWPDRGAMMMENLDPKTKQSLERDPNNPNAPAPASKLSTSKSVSNLRASTNSRPSIREAIAAQRKAQIQARKMPDRPGSAMAAISPTKPTPPPSASHERVASNSSSSSSRPARPPSSVSHRHAQASSSTSANAPSQGSLMSGPVRRPKRPEIARPATADPYARRKHLAPESPVSRGSPNQSPTKIAKQPEPTPSTTRSQRAKTSTATPTSPSPSHARHNAGKTHIPSPTSSTFKARPRTASSEEPAGSLGHGSPAAYTEELTMVMPIGGIPHLPAHTRAAVDQMQLPGSSPRGDEDGFTMVIPNLPATQTAPRSPLQAPRSPLRSSPLRQRSEPPIPDSLPTPASPTKYRLPSPRPAPSPRPQTASPTRDVEIQVHEDSPLSSSAYGQARSPGAGPGPLEELPINPAPPGRSPTPDSPLVQSVNNTAVTSPTRGPNFVAQTPQDRAESQRARRLLNSGIERIRARTLDAHGFRRLQDLVRKESRNPDVWERTGSPERGGEEFRGNRRDELIFALLGYIEDMSKPHDSRALSLKAQALNTITPLLSLQKSMHADGKANIYARALSSLLKARAGCEESTHLAAEVEKVGDDVVRLAARDGEGSSCIDAVINIIQRLGSIPQRAADDASSDNSDSEADDEHESRTPESTIWRVRSLIMGLSILSSLLSSQNVAKPATSDPEQRQRLGTVAISFLEDADPDVRRADMEFCLTLYDTVVTQTDEGKEGFWNAMKPANEGSLNLLAYYLARRGKA